MSGALKGDVTVTEPTRAQQVIARRAAESKATIPDITLDVELDMDSVLAIRRELIEASGEDHAPRPGDFILKASGLALREFPRINASYRDGRFELYSRVNIGMTVASDGSLAVPTILDVDRKSLSEIARESRTLAGRVQQGTISPAELAGATFTVTGLKTPVVARFQAVINPPQAAILAIGALRSVPLVRAGALRERTVLTAAMSCDHRIVYAAEAAAFLDRLQELLAEPHEWCAG